MAIAVVPEPGMPAAAAIEDTVVDEGLNIRLPVGSLFYN
jgi:hypothetical protein